ncbi:DUF3999 domain-containing protein [Desulfosarcina sp.]|uniref:DUF3999 domain-containing protein n=1 Tax=Desulfosarcina sp. TaxID=2027861 RepID=UPI003566FFFF
MRNWLWLVLVAFFAPTVSMADTTVNDFAYGIKIDVPAGSAVAAMSLPEEVYESAYRRDLGDVRVFNASGEPVPHMIRYAQTQPAEAPWQSLLFFPLPPDATSEAGGYRVYVRTGPDGAVVRVDPRSSNASVENARSFLIDLSRVGRSLAQLRLEWRRGESNLMATLAVDASDDLVDWTMVQQRSAISDIRHGGRRLLSNTISLNPTTKRYLRLRQMDSGPAISLIRIEGRIKPEGRTAIRVFFKTDGQPVPESPGVYEYHSTGVFPVDRVNLIFDQANSMAEAVVESRDDAKAAWTRRANGLFYRIDVDNTALTSAPQAVPVSMDRLWRLTVDASDSTIGSAVPQLELGYRPHDLFFIARGSGPFILAFGSAAVEPLKVNVAALFDGIGRHRDNSLERWVMPRDSRMVLGGPQRLTPLPKPLPMRRIVLWSVLLAGVLVVAVMSWRLARRLKQ